MSNARDEVMKMIRKKQDKIRHARSRRVRHEDVYNVIADFVRDMEAAVKNSKSFLEFDGCLNDAARKLNSGITRLDPTAQLSVHWNKDDDLTEKWDELAVDHVQITWSDHFANRTGRNKEETVDIGHLFFEGYFNT